MNLDYRASDLLGNVYKNGNILFHPATDQLYSTINNKIKVFDLKDNISSLLPFTSNYNIVRFTLSPSGRLAFIVDCLGRAHLINTAKGVAVASMKVSKNVGDIKFSPDSKYMAIAFDGKVEVYLLNKATFDSFNPWFKTCSVTLSSNKITHLNWSDDGEIIIAGGEDKQVAVFKPEKTSYQNQDKKMKMKLMTCHYGSIVSCFFLKNSYDCLSVDDRGYAILWKSNQIYGKYASNRDEEGKMGPVFFDRTERIRLQDAASIPNNVDCTNADFHQANNILVTSYANGAIIINEVPTFSMIQSIKVGDVAVKSVAFNKDGDWLGIASKGGALGQIAVWGWQSECYVMNQQSHTHTITCVQYSPSGSLIATGGLDGKVKIWDAGSGNCQITFTEHKNSVTCVCWTQGGNVILSSSLEGTVRAHDMKRYRNFRTFVCPEQTQLSCVTTDKTSDLVIAVAKDDYKIFIWTMDTGNLVDVLAGHSSRIAAIALYGNMLASVSWDKTMRITNIIDSSVETIQLGEEALSVTYAPCGKLMAVLTYDSSISMYSTRTSAPIGMIDTKFDVNPGRGAFDIIKKGTSSRSKTFEYIEFSPDSNLILAGGNTNYVCLYSVKDRVLLKKIQMTVNFSFDGVASDINFRQLTEFGNLDHVELSSDEEGDDNGKKKKMALAGTKISDAGERAYKPTMRANDVSYSPTGRSFAIANTEGVLIYSLDRYDKFDPFMLDVGVTPQLIETLLLANDYLKAIVMSMKLNDELLITRSLMEVPLGDIKIICQQLPFIYAEKLFIWMANNWKKITKRNIEFIYLFMEHLVEYHAMNFKGNARAVIPAVNGLLQSMEGQKKLLLDITKKNKSTVEYLLHVRKMADKKADIST
uniref:WD_REPEATS_REGION domain-containing protein n=1 Tax=Rhabditophanes sp. KR3021 TaxID=114890 RepID=A0AC35TNQ3_9BILA